MRRFVLAVVVCLLVACGAEQQAFVTSVQTPTYAPELRTAIAIATQVVRLATEPVPTETPFPTAPDIPTPTDTALPAPTSTPLSRAPVPSDANIRDLPTTHGSHVLAIAHGGTYVQLFEKSTDGAWLHVLADDGTSGWISAALVGADEGYVSRLTVLIPTATPTTDPYAAILAWTPIPTIDIVKYLTELPTTSSYGGGGTLCSDGSMSSSTGRGTCSHHGGIAGGKRRRRP